MTEDEFRTGISTVDEQVGVMAEPPKSVVGAGVDAVKASSAAPADAPIVSESAAGDLEKVKRENEFALLAVV